MAFETNKMEENIPPQFEEGLTESVEVCSENELLKSYTLESSFQNKGDKSKGSLTATANKKNEEEKKNIILLR